MKKLILLALFIILALPSSAQMVQDTFFGCKFGDSRELVKYKMENLGYSIFEKEDCILISCQEKNSFIRFGTIEFSFASFYFTGSDFSSIVLARIGTNTTKIAAEKAKLLNMLKRKYPMENTDDNSELRYVDSANKYISLTELKDPKPNFLLHYADPSIFQKKSLDF